MSKRFIGEQGLNQLMNNVKNDLNEKLNISDQITEEELVKQWNSVLGDELPNTNSLAHNHDERYYNKEEVDELTATHTHDVSEISNAVPNIREINNIALTDDIVLSASDVNALPISGGTVEGDLCIRGG